jgi:hypothetical protein
VFDSKRLAHTAQYIAKLQLESGALPWFTGGIVDPWDHVEAIMGLTVGGHTQAARRGFEWLQQTQRDDGAWHAVYNNKQASQDTRAESNFVAYPATGLWHYFQATGDLETVVKYWPMIERALNFVLSLQTPEGEIYWAVDQSKGISRDALVTGCSSIYKSLECAAALASVLNKDTHRLLQARYQLGNAIRHKPHRFDRTWTSKSRYSMDWFYPVLTGVIQHSSAQNRLTRRWAEFVEPNLGCRCVADEPWVTIAETSELIMACMAANDIKSAKALYEGIQRFQFTDGSWWTGYVFTDNTLWPDERPSWTAAAVLLAADALFRLTPAHSLFNQHR